MIRWLQIARVFVGDKGATVATTGFVARPGIYELPEGETQITVSDLLKLSGTTFVPPGAVVEALYFLKMARRILGPSP